MRIVLSFIITITPVQCAYITRDITSLVCFVAKSLGMGTYFRKNYPWIWILFEKLPLDMDIGCEPHIPSQSKSEHSPPFLIQYACNFKGGGCCYIAESRKPIMIHRAIDRHGKKPQNNNKCINIFPDVNNIQKYIP